MSVVAFSGILFAGSLLAGFIGSLTGLGGGVVIIPFLTLVFGVDIRYAVGASLISVIATSSGAASVYVKEGFSNIRIGMFLEVATTLGALAGALIASIVSPSLIAVLFGGVLVGTALMSTKIPKETPTPPGSDSLVRFLRLDGQYPGASGWIPYHIRAVPAGFGLMSIAGTLSGMLGIGSGALKVIAMDRIMRLPFKVSTATSNFMIGVTAAGSAGVYLHRGYIDPGLTMPVMLGVLAGSVLGTKVLVRAPARSLRRIFAVVIFFLGLEMIFHGITTRV
jgi:uncharacterized membrane protein YfcA